MSVKQLLQKYRFWQRQPFSEKPMSQEEHHCLNCGMDFTGNFCPRCGQKGNTGRLEWDKMKRGMLGLGNYSMKSYCLTFCHLLLRPGYLIDDYLAGRRRQYVPPYKLLIVLGVVFAILSMIPGFNRPEEQSHAYDLFLAWAFANKGQAYILESLFFIFPTWVLFRHAPRHPRHTFLECLFIQMYMETLLMMLSFAYFLHAGDWFIVMIPLCFMYAYGPLFGYGIWGTFWRVLLCVIVSVSMVAEVAFLAMYILGEEIPNNDWGVFIFFVVVSVIALVAGYFIGRHTEKVRIRKQTVQDAHEQEKELREIVTP